MSAVHTQREADEAQIKQQVARIAEGNRAKDLDGRRPIYATDVVSFDLEPPLQHVGIEAKLKNRANVFAVFRDADYEVRGLSVAVVSWWTSKVSCGRRLRNKFVAGISKVGYHSNDTTIEVVHLVGYMGESYVETRCREPGEGAQGGWTQLGRNTTHTGYQLRRALDLQSEALGSRLGLSN